MNVQAAFDFMRPTFVADAQTEFRIDLSDKIYGPHCYIEVKQNGDGTWAKRIGYQISYMGMAAPYHGSHSTADAALNLAVDYFRQSFQRTLDNPCSVQSEKDRVHLRRLIAWLKEVAA